MTVSIPISANPAPTISAIDAIRAAMRGIGEEGRALADVDFSKVIGAQDMLRDLDKVKQNLEDLLSVGRGQTAAAARQLFGDITGAPISRGMTGGAAISLAAFESMEREAARRFPDAAERTRFVRTVSQTALRGTRFDPAGYGGGEQYGPPAPLEQYGPPPPPPAPAPAPPPPPPPPPPPEPPKPFKLEDMGSTLKSGIMAGAGFFLAQAGLSSIASVAGQAMQAGEAENTGTDALMRRTGDLANSFDQLRHEADYFHKGLLASRIDMERYAGAFAQASGVTNIAEVMRATRIGVGVASGFGVDQGAMVQTLGRANFLGIAPEKFAEMVGESAVRGSMGGRVEEVMGALLRWTENASRVSATSAALTGNLGDFSSLYTAMNASGSPMLKGQNGVAVIDQVNSAITNGGGGGLAGQVEVTRALMAAGVTDPYEIQMRLAGGAFGRGADGKGQTNFELVQNQLHRDYVRGSNQAAIAGGTLLGLNPLVYKQLDTIVPKNLDIGNLDKTLQPYGGLAGINPSALPDIIKAQMAGPDELNNMGWRMTHGSAGSKLSKEQVEAINTASSPEKMRTAVIDALAKTGMPETDATRATEATNKLTDALATLGGALTPAVTALKDNLASLADKATPLFEWARKQMTPDAPAEDPTDGVIKFTNPSSENGTFPGGNRDWGSVGTPGGGTMKRMPIAPTIDEHSGMLSRIAMQESSGGTDPRAKGNIYGEIPTSFVEDVREVAKTDPAVAAMIAGMSNQDIAALENLDHADLQLKAARNHLRKSDAYTNGSSMMARYASWNFGKLGNDVMAAPDAARIGDVLGKNAAGVPDYLAHMTVGEWKKAKAKLFPEGETDGAGASGSGAGGAGGRSPITINPSTLHIIIDPAKRQVHEAEVQWAHTTDAPVPHGAGVGPALAPRMPNTPAPPSRMVAPSIGTQPLSGP